MFFNFEHRVQFRDLQGIWYTDNGVQIVVKKNVANFITDGHGKEYTIEETQNNFEIPNLFTLSKHAHEIKWKKINSDEYVVERRAKLNVPDFILKKTYMQQDSENRRFLPSSPIYRTFFLQ